MAREPDERDRDRHAVRAWILAVIVLDGLSLVIDAIDVGRYVAGERTAAVTLEDA